jgi:hypothetical protein
MNKPTAQQLATIVVFGFAIVVLLMDIFIWRPN